MTLERLTFGEILAGLAAIVLVATLFGPWFDGESAFGSFTVVLVLLLIVAVLGITLLLATAFERSQAYPVAAEVFGFAFAVVTTLVLVIELILRGDRGWAAWVGLAAVLGVACGCWRAMRAHTRR
jgi:predicted ABC-type exoprotein transport system permease subunit